jgi:hypothetical protein
VKSSRLRSSRLSTTAAFEAEFIRGAVLSEGRRKRAREAAALRCSRYLAGSILPFDTLPLASAPLLSSTGVALVGRSMALMCKSGHRCVRSVSLATSDTRDVAQTGVPIADPWWP